MQIITTSDAVATFCEALSKHPYITIDTEFLREKTYFPKLCLIQLSSPDKTAAAIDPLAKGIDLAPLFKLLENKAVLKIFHAGRQDLEIFYNLTGKVVTPFFDTQIAAMVCGYGDSVGYENLVRGITGGQIDKSSQFTDWSIRPLSEKQIIYALGDVTHLCDVYVHLAKELERRGRTDWVMQEESILGATSTYENDPYESWKRIKIRSPKPKSLAVLRELGAWRETAAQKRDVPKPWIMKDDTLAEIAGHAPRTKEQLKKIRGISNDMAEGKTGDQILAAIESALASPKENWPTPEKRDQIPPSAQAAIDILKMLLKVQSTEHEVAAKLIASQSDIEAIALSDTADVPALKGWRYEIFGKDALDLKHGKLSIGLKNDKVIKFDTKNFNALT
jgi:ribonuclease D